jgi:hypothetical protein
MWVDIKVCHHAEVCIRVGVKIWMLMWKQRNSVRGMVLDYFAVCVLSDHWTMERQPPQKLHLIRRPGQRYKAPRVSHGKYIARVVSRVLASQLLRRRVISAKNVPTHRVESGLGGPLIGITGRWGTLSDISSIPKRWKHRNDTLLIVSPVLPFKAGSEIWVSELLGEDTSKILPWALKVRNSKRVSLRLWF